MFAGIPVFTGWEVDGFVHTFMFTIEDKRSVTLLHQFGHVEGEPGADICVIDQLAVHRRGAIVYALRACCLPSNSRFEVIFFLLQIPGRQDSL